MHIVVDKDIFRAEDYFGTLGTVVKVDGRRLNPASVQQAEVLIVRSITTVDAKLLRGSAVRFVGSVTSGTDHIDLNYLRDNGIGFSSAAGCNARAVAEYVLSSLMVLTELRDMNMTGKTAAIIGCGHAGSLVRDFLHTLGLSCVVNDPPLRDAGDGRHTGELAEVYAANVISLHVPLTDAGPYPTRYLVDAGFLQCLRPDVILINTSRGEVIDETALLAFLRGNHHSGTVLDVWQSEPEINTELLRRADIGTAHIAGHTLDSKLRAVAMVYHQACACLQQPARVVGAEPFPQLAPAEIAIAADVADFDAMQMAVLTGYDVRTDSGALRQMLELEPDRRGKFFDALRSGYRTRREFSALRVKLPTGSAGLAGKLERLGFRTSLQS